MTDRPWINARYRIDAKLGEGGMGRVFAATDMRLERRVALKLMPRVDRPDLIERFHHEAMAVARLNHPHIVIIHDYDQADPADPAVRSLVLPITAAPTPRTRPHPHPAAVDSDAGMSSPDQPIPHGAFALPAVDIDVGVDPEAETGEAEIPQPFIVMEYLPGANIDRAGLDDIGDVVRVAIQLTEALAYAHDQGVIHRDIKPDNIRLLPSGRAKLLDFGIATFVGRPRLTESGELVGTYAYMSPEQALGLEVGPRSDLYSLGLVLYELLTGVLPFTDDNPVASLSQRVALAPVSIRTVRPDIPAALDDVVGRALARQPRHRFADAREFGQALRDLVARAALPTSETRTTDAPAVADASAGADSSPASDGPPGNVGGRPQPLVSADTAVLSGAPRLVARAAEVDALERALYEARRGRGSAVLVGGVPGIGKTTLVERAVEMAVALGFDVRRGRVLDESRVSFEPFLHVVRDDLRNRRPSRDWLGTDVDVLAATLHDFDTLVPTVQTDVDVPIVVDDPTPLTRPSNRARLAALHRYLDRAAADSPLLVVLEDFHDADAPSVALLRRLIEGAHDAPLVVLVEHCRRGLQRDEPMHAMLYGTERDTTARRLTLEPLTRPQTAELVAQHQHLASASPGFVDAVHFASGGRPGYALALLPPVAPAVWPDSPDALHVPESVRESLERDVELLAAPTPRLLSLAAVLGPCGFDFDTLIALAGDDDDEAEDQLIDALQAATTAWLVRTTDDIRYHFDCDVVRRVLYERMHPRRRARAHRRAAELVAGRRGPSKPLAAALRELELARHLARGGRPALTDDALDALERALEASSAPLERVADRVLLRSCLHALRRRIATHAPLMQRAASFYLGEA